jgi:signal transduction histidine kinase
MARDGAHPLGLPEGSGRGGGGWPRWRRLRLGDWSVRLKLLGLIAVSSFFSLAVAGVAMIVSDLVQFKRANINSLTTQARMLAAISGAALVFNDPQAAGEYLGTLRARVNTRCAAIYAADGTVFASYERPGGPPCDTLPPEPDGYREDGDDLVMFQGIEQGGERVGTVYLRQHMNRTERALNNTGIVAAVLVGSLLLGLLLSARLQRTITRPLSEIAQVAQGVTERRDWSLRAVKAGNDEVGVLTDAFNQMLGQIERSADELRAANQQLQQEIAEHRRARDEVLALNATLELRVAQRTRQLEDANKELEGFSYSVSHDLRAPLRAIDGFSAAVLQDQGDQLDERGRGHLERVRAATRRMGQLIDDLLNLARTTRAEIRRRELDLSELAHSVAREIQASHPDWKVQFDIEPGLRAFADAPLMRAVLDNLLGNAAKFSARQAAPRVALASLQQDGQTVFVVRDNGVGFDMAYAGKLFGAFQRLHSTSEFEGTGVGLANVQRIIHRHGGRVWAESRLNEGASFFFTLPD